MTTAEEARVARLLMDAMFAYNTYRDSVENNDSPEIQLQFLRAWLALDAQIPDEARF